MKHARREVSEDEKNEFLKKLIQREYSRASYQAAKEAKLLEQSQLKEQTQNAYKMQDPSDWNSCHQPKKQLASLGSSQKIPSSFSPREVQEPLSELYYDVFDFALDKKIELHINHDIKDSKYLVEFCQNMFNPFIQFKRQNILKNKKKDQEELLSRVNKILKLKEKERGLNWRRNTTGVKSMDSLCAVQPYFKDKAFANILGNSLIQRLIFSNIQQLRDQGYTFNIQNEKYQKLKMRFIQKMFQKEVKEKMQQQQKRKLQQMDFQKKLQVQLEQQKQHNPRSSPESSSTPEPSSSQPRLPLPKSRQGQFRSSFKRDSPTIDLFSKELTPIFQEKRQSKKEGKAISKPRTSFQHKRLQSYLCPKYKLDEEMKNCYESQFNKSKVDLGESTRQDEESPSGKRISWGKRNSNQENMSNRFSTARMKLLQQIPERPNIQTSQAQLRKNANYFSVCCSPEYSRFSQKSVPIRNQNLFGKKAGRANFFLEKESSECYFSERKEKATQIKTNCESYMGILPDQEEENNIKYPQKLDLQFEQENIRQKHLDDFLDLTSKLDYINKPYIMEEIVKYNLQNRKQAKKVQKDVEQEFKQGINDPSRETAQFEKKKNMQKFNLKKSKILAMQKKYQLLKEQQVVQMTKNQDPFQLSES